MVTVSQYSVMSFPQPDLRRFRTYKGNSVRDLLRAMRNKVRLTFSCVSCHTWLLLLLLLRRTISDPFCVSSPPAAETSLPRVAPGCAGDAGRAAGGLRRLLHVALSAVTDAHARRHARVQPGETVSPVLSESQQQIGVTRPRPHAHPRMHLPLTEPLLLLL